MEGKPEPPCEMSLVEAEERLRASRMAESTVGSMLAVVDGGLWRLG